MSLERAHLAFCIFHHSVSKRKTPSADFTRNVLIWRHSDAGGVFVALDTLRPVRLPEEFRAR